MPGVLTLTINQGPQRSRLTTFFRILLLIPHAIVVFLWGIVALLATIVAWFAILFTGRYPAGLWDFVAGWVRYDVRVTLYGYLAVDAFPPFNGGPDGYAVQLAIPRLERYDRLKTLLRIFYILPGYILVVILGYVFYVVGFVDWLVIVIMGRQPDGLQQAVVWMAGWGIRVVGLGTLVTESYGLDVQSGVGLGGLAA